MESHIADAPVSAPELLDLEVINALRRLIRAKRLQPARADAAVDDLVDLPIARWPHVPLARRIWSLRAHLSPYDAAYVALAERLDADLVTTDERLARTHGHQVRITAFPG